jgi:hypothetical protein
MSIKLSLLIFAQVAHFMVLGHICVKLGQRIYVRHYLFQFTAVTSRVVVSIDEVCHWIAW